MFEKRIRPNNSDRRVVAGQPEQTGVLTQSEQTRTGNPDTNLHIQKEAQQRHNQGLESLHRELSGGNQSQVEKLGEGDPEKLSRRGFIKFLGIGFVSCFVPSYLDANNKGGILNPSPLPKKSSGGSSRLPEVRRKQSRAVNPNTTNLPTQSTQSAGQRHAESLQQFRRGATIEEDDPREGIPIEDLLKVGLLTVYLLSEVLPRMYLAFRRLLRFPHSFDKIEVGKNQITVFLDQKLQEASREKTELDRIIRDLKKVCNFLPESFLSGTNAILLETRYFYSSRVHPMDNRVILNVAGLDVYFTRSNRKDFLNTIFHELTHTITHRCIFRLILSLNLENMWVNLKILNRDELRTWLEISKNNGGYLSKFFSPRKNWDSVKSKANKKGFGFVDPKYRYGALSIKEDIACVFEKVLTVVYLIKENPGTSEDYKSKEAARRAKELMELTPADVDLWRKYVIACNILIRMYGKELKQKQERARALGGRDTQLDSRIQSITETIGILLIFRETFDNNITSHTQNPGLTTKLPVMTNGYERSDNTNSGVPEN